MELDKDLALKVAKHEQEHREFSDKISVRKDVILTSLLGTGKFDQGEVNLKKLFDQYFNKLVDPVFTEDDLDLIVKKHAEFSDIKALRLKVKKGSYVDPFANKRNFICQHLKGNDKLIFGASGIDRAVWFVFTNEKVDVNCGSIYIRRNRISALKLFCTFEINPFSKGKTIVTNTETGIAEEKEKLTYNPGWLSSTINNMEKEVFKLL